MPGHMNVLLAEADVPYDQLYEMNDINQTLPNTDLVLIVGACDVVNPAAIETEGTPISGMPILNVHKAKHVIVCNLDERPGYSGVENPLYRDEKVIMLLGDAKESLGQLIISLDNSKDAAPVGPKDMAGQVAEVTTSLLGHRPFNGDGDEQPRPSDGSLEKKGESYSAKGI